MWNLRAMVVLGMASMRAFQLALPSAFFGQVRVRPEDLPVPQARQPPPDARGRGPLGAHLLAATGWRSVRGRRFRSCARLRGSYRGPGHHTRSLVHLVAPSSSQTHCVCVCVSEATSAQQGELQSNVERVSKLVLGPQFLLASTATSVTVCCFVERSVRFCSRRYVARPPASMFHGRCRGASAASTLPSLLGRRSDLQLHLSLCRSTRSAPDDLKSLPTSPLSSPRWTRLGGS